MNLEQAKEVLTVESEGILTVRDSLGNEFNKAVDLIMSCPTRLVITGIGKSGIIGQKISATLNSTGTPSFFLHPVEAMHGDLGMVASTDVVLAISYSGETTELNMLLASLKERSVKIIAMTGNVNSTLSSRADITLCVKIEKEACPFGLAPTTSTTATLALGDALAVSLLQKKQFGAEDFRRNHPGGSLGERLKIAVSEVMLTGNDIPLILRSATLKQAIQELNNKNLGAVIIISESHELCGIITDGDLRRLLSLNVNIENLAIEDVMTKTPVTIEKHVMAADALSVMQSKEITVLPVVSSGNGLVGILHLHDLLGKGEFRFLI